MSSLFVVLIASVCVVPALIYNYQHYKKYGQERLAFILTNCVAVLGVFTLYLASLLSK